MADLSARDRSVVWHPYAAPEPNVAMFPVERASGVRLHLTDGRELIDGMSSWWAAIHGYNHPALNEAVHRQVADMSHVMFGGLTHRPAVELCERLVAMTPEPLNRVFLCDSGSVSVEVAIKLALQYWQARGQGGRQRLLTVRGGYHGDTFGAMAVCDPVGGMHSLFRGVLPQHLFAPLPGPAHDQPWDTTSLDAFEQLLRDHAQEVAAVILEPVVQGAGGMRFYHPEYLRGVRALCNEHDVLLIADEIATGFGRSGPLFACEHAAVVPDILCVGKALTGGTMTLAATLSAEHVWRTLGEGEPGLFMHGPTFMGNPLACAVALASLDLLLDSPWQHRVSSIEQQLSRELARCRQLPGVHDVRVLGAIGVVELDHQVDMARIQPAFVEQGVWLRPFGKLVYTMPPYVIEASDLTAITDAMHAVLSSDAAQPVPG